MAILAFQKPDKVIMLNSTEQLGTFEFRPLEPGYGITIGNALRRILLSSLEGYAITTIRISGVDHEFSTIKGVVEDVTEIILNLKQVRFKRQIESTDSEKVHVTINGKNQFVAGDIAKHTSAFQVLNPELVICNMETSVKFQIDITIDKGRGYVPSEENKSNAYPVGTVAIDSIFTPIRNVRYNVENYRVEQKTDYEKLVLEIATDGSIAPKDALREAAEILIHHFMLFSDEKITLESLNNFVAATWVGITAELPGAATSTASGRVARIFRLCPVTEVSWRWKRSLATTLGTLIQASTSSGAMTFWR